MSELDKEKQILNIDIEEEMTISFINYAISVITSRALPDVRDGLKPVHRRILYSMYEMGLKFDKSFKKAGRIVGDVLGKYHPHGDQSIYEALVRLAQDFSLRYPVIKGQGNFGSIDGDPPAAMRYTEAKMTKIAEDMIKDIDKETINFKPNYDDSLREPEVLPSSFPFLLVNGTSGIAVGMATNMPPHNLREICNAIIYTVENEDVDISDLLKIVKGPDFPTYAEIIYSESLIKAYRTGKGSVVIRARYHIEENQKELDKNFVVITEIPYVVNKSNLLIKIANLMKEDKLEGLIEVRDESDREGIRVVLEVKKGFDPHVIINLLYEYTELKKNFSINNLALIKGSPKQLNLKEIIDEFIQHRKEVIRRRVEFDLEKAESKAHVLEGLRVALNNIDVIIKTIKNSKIIKEAKEKLIENFELSEIQAQAVLDMRLHKLTSLEIEKLETELNELLILIEDYKSIIADSSRIIGIIKEETLNLSLKFGDERRTKIIYDDEVLKTGMSDLIQKENVVIILTNKGFVKRFSQDEYKLQSRGGKGLSSTDLKEGDAVKHLLCVNTHDFLMMVSNEGKVYYINAYEIKESSRSAKGQNLKELINLGEKEKIVNITSFKDFSVGNYLLITTSNGKIAKIGIGEFKTAKTRGIIAVKLEEKDVITSLAVIGKDQELMCISKLGNSLRFAESEIRLTKRGTQGVKGMRLKKGDMLFKALGVGELQYVLIISEHGYGKRLEITDVVKLRRGSSGVICYKADNKTGFIKDVVAVNDIDEIILTSEFSRTLRTAVSSISIQGRFAKGVQILSLEGDEFSSVSTVLK